MNETKYLIVAFLSIIGLSFWGDRSYAWGEVVRAMENHGSSNAWNGLKASELIGQNVTSPTGGNLGKIIDLLTDRSDGHISLVILSGVPGFGPEFVAVPFGSLERNGEALKLTITSRTVPSAPAPGEDPYAYELKTFESIVGLSSISSSIPRLWADVVYRFYGQTPYWTEDKTSAGDLVSYRIAQALPSKAVVFEEKTIPGLIGATVRLQSTQSAEKIDDLIIDSEGRAVLLVLTGIKGRNDQQVAVPFGELSMRDDAFVLNTTEERLAKAPGFNKRADLNDSQRAEDIYRYFGEEPFWTIPVTPEGSKDRSQH